MSEPVTLADGGEWEHSWRGKHVGLKDVPYFGPKVSVSPGQTILPWEPATVGMTVQAVGVRQPSATQYLTPREARDVAALLIRAADVCDLRNMAGDPYVGEAIPSTEERHAPQGVQTHTVPVPSVSPDKEEVSE